jgi:hypothetical protein
VLPFQSMKMFLLLMLTVTALFVWQRNDNHGANEAKPTRETPATVSSPARTTSEHDWAKHSLDRAHDVAEQVRKSRQGNNQP